MPDTTLTGKKAPQQEETSPDAKERKIIRPEFRGSASEYFRIWIVNAGLSIITLGIYSPWAKVRNRQYLYGNTILDSSVFQYTANPLNILKGRIIAAAIFGLIALSNRFFPEFAALLFLALWPLVPWLVVKALRFKSRYTVYRNIHFQFTGSVKEAYKYWLWMYFLVPLTMGLIIPYLEYRQKKYIVNENRYGKTPFGFTGKWEPFLVYYILGGLISFGLMILVGVLITGSYFAIMAMTGTALPETTDETGFLIPLMTLIYTLYILAILFFISYKNTSVFNYIVNNTSLGSISFTSSLKVKKIFLIYLGNLFAVLFSLGLLYPWALVRLLRYRINNICLETDSDLDSFAASEDQRISAMGEEIGEVFDFDLSI